MRGSPVDFVHPCYCLCLCHLKWGLWKNNNFTVEKSGRHHLTTWSKLTSPILGQTDICISITMHWKGQSNSLEFLPTMHYLPLIMRKHQNNQNLKKLYKITVKVKKEKGRLKNYSRLMHTKEVEQLNALSDPGS